VLGPIVQKLSSIQLLEAVSDQRLVGRQRDFIGKAPGEAVDGPRAVGQPEHHGRGAIEAVSLLAREIVDDQLVGDLLEQEVGSAGPGIRSRNDGLPEQGCKKTAVG